MWYHIITAATPFIHLALSFGGGQRSSPLLSQFLLLQAWDLWRMAESLVVVRREKVSTEGSGQRWQGSQVPVRANCLGGDVDRQKLML